MIPWHIFIEALKDQSLATIDRWLQRWRFTDAGVVLVEPERSSSDTSQSDNGNGQRETVSGGHRSAKPITQPGNFLSKIESILKSADPHLGGQLLREL